jgi:hypothetical protein
VRPRPQFTTRQYTEVQGEGSGEPMTELFENRILTGILFLT